MHQVISSRIRRLVVGGGLAALALSLATPVALADSHGEEEHEHKNMKVLEHPGKPLKKYMKDFSKGLGVKCTTCHVKKDFDSEKKEMKDKTRFFFEETVGEADPAKRQAALAKLLKLLELEKVRDEARLWKGIDAMKKKEG